MSKVPSLKNKKFYGGSKVNRDAVQKNNVAESMFKIIIDLILPYMKRL